jgi:hypothetical protein
MIGGRAWLIRWSAALLPSATGGEAVARDLSSLAVQQAPGSEWAPVVRSQGELRGLVRLP